MLRYVVPIYLSATSAANPLFLISPNPLQSQNAYFKTYYSSPIEYSSAEEQAYV
jgi:hypothetical protein